MSTAANETNQRDSKSVMDAALTLSTSDRAKLAELLWASLDDFDELTGDQLSELKRRSQEITDGTARMIPADEALRLIRERKRV